MISQHNQKTHPNLQQQINNSNTTASMIQITHQPFSPISPVKSQYYTNNSYSLQKSKHKPKQISYQNMGMYEANMLREQNKLLKKQIYLMKGESQIWTADSSRHDQHYQKLQSLDARQFNKKQEEELLELRNWVDVLTKQCKMYEEIINKMDQNIASLTQQNKKLNNDIKIISLEKENMAKTYKLERIQLTQKYAAKQSQNGRQMKQLKQKVNKIMQMYGQLESASNTGQIQWAMWKQKWNKQKMVYVNKIQQLKGIIFGIRESSTRNNRQGSQSKDKYQNAQSKNTNTNMRQNRKDDRYDNRYDSIQDRYRTNDTNSRVSASNVSYQRSNSPTNRNTGKQQSRRKY